MFQVAEIQDPVSSLHPAIALIESANKLFGNFAGLSDAPELTRDAARRADMWIMRKGLYTKVAGNRPKGTAALLEDVAVPMESLDGVCSDLQVLFDQHGYADAVIFGHAKDGNIHFLVTEDFAGPKSLQRFENFTGSLVDLILGKDGTLKAEVVSYEDLMACGTMVAAKEKGLIRSEGKEYVVQDGDIILFRFNV